MTAELAETALEFEADAEDLNLFLEDSQEQLALLDQEIIRLEKDPDDALLQAIFRAAHTLKGSSATIGHTKMATLTHAMEEVLDELRNERLPVTTFVIDTLLESLDALRVLLDEVTTLRDSGMDFAPLVTRLHALREADAAAAAGEPPGSAALVVDEALVAAIEGKRATGLLVHDVEIVLSDDCVMPAVRLFQCLVELNGSGAVLHSVPSSDEIEREQVHGTLRAIYATDVEATRVPALLEPVLDLGRVAAWPHGSAVAAVDERSEAAAGAAADGPERRRIDLGPEARGTSADDQLRLAAKKLGTPSKSVRIDVERLDSLMNLTGELVIDRGRLAALLRKFRAASLDPALLESFDETAAHLGVVTSGLQDEVMKSRMQPVANVFNRFPRMVRDLARKAGKEVDLRISGEETELDRSVIEEIGDPLIHLLRNAVDHGIEMPEEREAAGKPRTGVVHLSSAHEDNAIVIRVQDDGRGIDPQRVRSAAVRRGLLSQEAVERLSDQEAIELIWAPGFSTVAEVTDVSGRGVGMDIVRTNIAQLNGTTSVTSELGRGATFSVRVPLTLAVIQGLLLRVRDSLLVLPLSSVTATMKVRRREMRSVQGRMVFRLRDQLLSLIDLGAILGLPPATGGAEGEDAEERFVVAVRTGSDQAGFIVDELLGQEEVVIKNLGSLLRRTRGISGATLMGDELALIGDVPNLLQLHRERQGVAA